MSSRWVLPDKEAAFRWCGDRNKQKIRCTFDILGHFTKEESVAKDSYDAYLELANEIAAKRLNASVSIKLSTLGGTMNRDLSVKLTQQLAARTNDLGVGLEIDMEGQRMVDLILMAAEECVNSGTPVTVALQAYLRRTPQDLERMLDSGVRVRFVKGAYVGDISDFSVIQETYKDLVEQTISRDVKFCVATHDPEILDWVRKIIKYKDKVEFGFLKGLADDTKESLSHDGWQVLEYVPFGSSKEGYEARRNTYLKKLEEIGRQPAP